MERTQLTDGRRLAWRMSGSGPPLVLLHGWAMSSAVFAEIAPLLAEDFAVYTPDLPGHGDSEPARSWTATGLAADLADWLRRIDIDRCAVLGWSLGGQLAMRLAVDFPHLIGKLILVATTPRFVAAADWDGGLPEGQVKSMERQLRRNFELAMSDFFARMFIGEDLPRERYRHIIAGTVRGARLPLPEDVLSCLDLLRSTDLRAALAELLLPVMVHYGDADVITPPAAGRYLAAGITGAREVCWTGIGHAPFLSRSDESAALWREFLQS